MKILAITPEGKHDYLVSSIIEGLNKYDIEIYYTGYGNGETNRISDEEFINHYSNCDFIFAFWGKSVYNGVPSPKFHLIDSVNGWDKTIYIDGSEYNHTGFPGKTTEQLNPMFFGKCRKYFKRECLPEHIDEGVIPLPFAAVDSDFKNLPKVEKDIDVLCAYGQTSTGQRQISVDVCEELKQEGYNIINHTVPNYFELMNRAWITIDAFGGGECNARTFQVMANKSLLFMERYNIVMPDMVDGVHCVSWKDAEDLKNKIKQYLLEKDKIRHMIKESCQNVIDNHTSIKRVEYIFKNIQ